MNRRSRSVAVASAVFLAAACSSAEPTPVSESIGQASTGVPGTTEPAVSTAAPNTPDAPTSTEAPSTTGAPSPTEVPATIDATEPQSSGAVGALDFNRGSDPPRDPSIFGYSALTEVEDSALLDDVSETLGDPDDDTGWIPMPNAYACTGATEYRSLLWDDIRFVLTRSADLGATYVAAWSIGDTALAFSPPLDAEITEASGITTADGIGLGTSADRLEDVGWDQFLREDDRFLGLAGTGPVEFHLDAAEQVVAMSYEQNDC